MKSGDVEGADRARREPALLAAAATPASPRRSRRSSWWSRSPSLPDETSEQAHLVLPDHTPLESWGDAAPRPGVRSLVQPAIRPLFDTQAIGDTLLGIARAMGDAVGGAAAGRQLPQHRRGGLGRHRLARARSRAAASSATAPTRRSPASRRASRASSGRSRSSRATAPSCCCRCRRRCSATAAARTCPGSRRRRIRSRRSPGSRGPRSARRTAESLGVRPGDVLSIETTFGTRRGAGRGRAAASATTWSRSRSARATPSGTTPRWPTTAARRRARRQRDLAAARAHRRDRRPRLAGREGARSTATGRFQRLPFTQTEDNKRGRLLGEAISLVALAEGGPSPLAPTNAAALDPERRGRSRRGDGDAARPREHGGEHHGGRTRSAAPSTRPTTRRPTIRTAGA